MNHRMKRMFAAVRSRVGWPRYATPTGFIIFCVVLMVHYAMKHQWLWCALQGIGLLLWLRSLALVFSNIRFEGYVQGYKEGGEFLIERVNEWLPDGRRIMRIDRSSFGDAKAWEPGMPIPPSNLLQ